MTKIIFIFVNLLIICTLAAKNIGINNADPQSSLDISGDLRLRSHTLTLSFSYQHDLDISTHQYSVYKIDPTATTGAIITGMTGGVDGRIVTFINTSTAWSLQFYPENDPISTLSTESNRFVTPIGQPIIVSPSGSASFRYDGTKMRWTALSGSFAEGLDTYPNAWPTNGLDIYSYNIGNVGIGVVNPSEKLEVFGNVKTNGEIKPNGISGQINEVLTSNGDGTMQWMPLPTTSGNTGNYGTVTNPITGKTWLDRNLGADQIATSSTDALSYGHLFQWARAAEGHEFRYSATTVNLAGSWYSGFGYVWKSKFILTTSPPNNWLSTNENFMWEGLGAENNPCPSGFRLPTIAEWEQEKYTWNTYNAAGAFASILKLPKSGYRSSSNGAESESGQSGWYWSSTHENSQWNNSALFFKIEDGSVSVNYLSKATGCSVRCIKD